MTREQLEQQIKDMKEANEALVDGHGKLAVAYLAQRVIRLEEKADKQGMRIGDLERKLVLLSDRVDKAARVVKKLQGEA